MRIFPRSGEAAPASPTPLSTAWRRLAATCRPTYGLVAATLLLALPGQAQRRLEKLDRGVVAIRTGANAVFVGWRVLGTDPSGLTFNVYRGATKLNAAPITGATNLTDNVAADETYSVRPVLNGTEQTASTAASVWAQTYLRIPIVLLMRPCRSSSFSCTFSTRRVASGIRRCNALGRCTPAKYGKVGTTFICH